MQGQSRSFPVATRATSTTAVCSGVAEGSPESFKSKGGSLPSSHPRDVPECFIFTHALLGCVAGCHKLPERQLSMQLNGTGDPPLPPLTWHCGPQHGSHRVKPAVLQAGVAGGQLLPSQAVCPPSVRERARDSVTQSCASLQFSCLAVQTKPMMKSTGRQHP